MEHHNFYYVAPVKLKIFVDLERRKNRYSIRNFPILFFNLNAGEDICYKR